MSFSFKARNKKGTRYYVLYSGTMYSVAGCPSDFTSAANSCYKLVTYLTLNWTDAALACRGIHRDAHLLVINDVMEQLALPVTLTRQSLHVFLHLVAFKPLIKSASQIKLLISTSK